MSNDEATVLLENMPEGHFLLRNHTPAEGVYALSVVYKGNATHHKVRVPEGGNVMVNNAQTPATNLEELIEHLGEKRKYWPVALMNHVKPGVVVAKAAPSSPKTTASAVEAVIDLERRTSTATPPPLPGTPSGTGLLLPPAWLHGRLSRERVELLLKEEDGTLVDGTFLVRKHESKSDPNNRASDGFVLSCNYNAKVTHHRITRDGAKGWCINKKQYTPQPVTKLEELVAVLCEEPLPPGWPLLLKTGIKSLEGEHGGTWSKHARKAGIGVSLATLYPWFGEMDLNNDGQLSREELKIGWERKEIQEVLSKVIFGFVDEDKPVDFEQLMGFLDSDKSGTVSIFEFLDGLGAMSKATHQSSA
jgi:hypothetical protein